MRVHGLFWVASFAVATLAVGCFNSSEYEIKKIQTTTAVSVPLAFGSLNVQDILNKVDKSIVDVKVYPDGLVYFQYVKTFESTDIRKLFVFPNKNLNLSLPVLPGSIPASATELRFTSVSSTLDFNFSPEKLKEIQFKSGNITVSTSLFPANPNFVFEVEVKLANFLLNGVPFQTRALSSTNFSLTNYIATLNDNKFPVDLALIIKPHTNTITVAPGTILTVGLSFSGMDFKYIKGFLGDRSTAIIPQTFNLDAFGAALDKSKVSFADPRFSVEISNDYGIPVTLTFNTLEARKNSTKVTMVTNPASPMALVAPAVLGQTTTSMVFVTNAKQITDLVPDEIYYSAAARINQSLTSGNNFCADTSKLRIKIRSEVPLYGSASGIILTDTFGIDLSAIKSSEVQTASLKAKVINELPLDATIQIYLADDKSLVTDSIFTTSQTAIVVGSKVNAIGELLSSGVYDNEIPLNQDKINKLLNAKKLIVKSVMKTVRNASGSPIDVKFKSTYKMDINIGLNTVLKINRDL